MPKLTTQEAQLLDHLAAMNESRTTLWARPVSQDR
jgi:hypothetical protein